MYKSPITIMQGVMKFDFENEIFKAVQKVGIDVDREELIKALQYDRQQYDKGYADGKVGAVKEFANALLQELDLLGYDESYFGITAVKVVAGQFGVEVGK